MGEKRSGRKFQSFIQKYWPSFSQRYFDLIPDYIHKVITKVTLCRTEALGAHAYKCPACGFTSLLKHSCKSRFCSSCGTAYTDKWSYKIKYWLSFINANYYFVTFTIPKKLEEILKANKRAGYSLLFKSSSYAILSFYKEKRVKGGIISILQTFGRTLNFHPHIHLLCTVGGLLFNRTAWKEVFLPAMVLQKRFKYHFLDGLRELYRQGELQLPGGMSFANYTEFDLFLRELGKRHWQIDRSEPLDAVRSALAYIARYLGKPPMSENRLRWYNINKVCFVYKDYLNKAVERKFICSNDEFFFRFLEHTPLPNFPMVRFYGLFSTRSKKKLIAKAAEFIPPSPAVEMLRCEPPKTCREHRLATTGVDISKCPKCGEKMELAKVYYPGSLNVTFQELLKQLENYFLIPQGFS